MRKTKPWEEFEAFVAERLALRRTISSGNKFYDPGDAVSADRHEKFPLYADAKCTSANSFSLKAYELRQWGDRAMEEGKHLILPVRFWSPTGHHEDYVTLSFDDFETMLSLARTS